VDRTVSVDYKRKEKEKSIYIDLGKVDRIVSVDYKSKSKEKIETARIGAISIRLRIV
jgi:hypothetical protein